MKSNRTSFFKVAFIIVAMFFLFFPGEINAEELEFTVVDGEDPLERNLEITGRYWEQADTVVLVGENNYPDALAGAPLAYSLDAPVLLVPGNGLTDDVSKEFNRLGVEKVIILGGEQAVSAEVKEDLAEKGLNVKRVWGKDRYETAKRVALEMDFNGGRVVVASGENFPDAVAIGAYAAKREYPVLLTRENSIPESTMQLLQYADNTLVVGGPAVISVDIERKMPGVLRIWGEDRRQTSLEIARQLGLNSRKIYIAPDDAFEEGLLASVAAARDLNPVLLAESEKVNDNDREALRDWLAEKGLQQGLEQLVVLPGDEDEDEEEEEYEELVFEQKGTASWYGSNFHGSRTASGEIYNQYELTAAHRELPFGTIVEVEFPRTGKKVEVRINDRGPHISGRIIDLSRGAAEAIGLKPYGLGEVIIRVYE